MKNVLTIAGSDSGGGAGVQADLRTIAALGCHGSTVITAITAQNSRGVQRVFPLEPEAVSAQLASVLSDMGAAAAKTGMLFSAEVIRALAAVLETYPVERLVVDPVMVAKGGALLLREDARSALVRELLPRAKLVTPNLPEAEVLTGMEISSEAAEKEACRRILALGPAAVLLKGGHASGDEIRDVYADREGSWEIFRARRIPTPHTHGTGCTLSAAIATKLALGLGLLDAIAEARRFLERAILHAYPMGA
ncbi:MAG: bifunctional hydroxymethylpyrimidine kinase/phosphomethylpyrimidine kinase, partial [Deltaproteobacteria bacterium]|nr:bifunctional hydroxymethylpyrimidine kinase/phosphomethylpyrimidine kinase [Deltaproteobacteria bacterium]